MLITDQANMFVRFAVAACLKFIRDANRNWDEIDRQSSAIDGVNIFMGLFIEYESNIFHSGMMYFLFSDFIPCLSVIYARVIFIAKHSTTEVNKF